MERVDALIRRDVPTRRKRRFEIERAAPELHEFVVDRIGTGVEIGARRVLPRIESSGAAFGTENERPLWRVLSRSGPCGNSSKLRHRYAKGKGKSAKSAPHMCAPGKRSRIHQDGSIPDWLAKA